MATASEAPVGVVTEAPKTPEKVPLQRLSTEVKNLGGEHFRSVTAQMQREYQASIDDSTPENPEKVDAFKNDPVKSEFLKMFSIAEIDGDGGATEDDLRAGTGLKLESKDGEARQVTSIKQRSEKEGVYFCTFEGVPGEEEVPIDEVNLAYLLSDPQIVEKMFPGQTQDMMKLFVAVSRDGDEGLVAVNDKEPKAILEESAHALGRFTTEEMKGLITEQFRDSPDSGRKKALLKLMGEDITVNSAVALGAVRGIIQHNPNFMSVEVFAAFEQIARHENGASYTPSQRERFVQALVDGDHKAFQEIIIEIKEVRDAAEQAFVADTLIGLREEAAALKGLGEKQRTIDEYEQVIRALELTQEARKGELGISSLLLASTLPGLAKLKYVPAKDVAESIKENAIAAAPQLIDALARSAKLSQEQVVDMQRRAQEGDFSDLLKRDLFKNIDASAMAKEIFGKDGTVEQLKEMTVLLLEKNDPDRAEQVKTGVLSVLLGTLLASFGMVIALEKTRAISTVTAA